PRPGARRRSGRGQRHRLAGSRSRGARERAAPSALEDRGGRGLGACHRPASRAARPPLAGPIVARMSVAPYEGRFGTATDLRRLAGRAGAVNVIYQVGLAAVVLLRGLAVGAFVSRADYGLWGLLGLAIWTALAVRYLGVNDRYVQQADGEGGPDCEP